MLNNTHEKMLIIAKLNAQCWCMPGTEDYLYELYGAYMIQLGVEWNDVNWDEFEVGLANKVFISSLCKTQYDKFDKEVV